MEIFPDKSPYKSSEKLPGNIRGNIRGKIPGKMPEKLTLYHFLKAAFHEKIKLPGMEQLPLNKILLSSAFLLGALNPWVWLLGAAGESLYLTLLAGNRNYRKIVEGNHLLKLKERWDEKQKEILKEFDSATLERYDLLVGDCAAIMKKTAAQSADPLALLKTKNLNQLVRMFLRLLSSRTAIVAMLSEGCIEKLERDIAGITEKISQIPGEPHSSPLRHSLQGTLEIQERRLQNFRKAENSLNIIDAELVRIEKQVALLKEETTISSDPELLSVKLDSVMDSLSGTNRWMTEQDQLFGLKEENTIPEAFIYPLEPPGKEEM